MREGEARELLSLLLSLTLPRNSSTMCQSCTPQKLHRTYSRGLVVQVRGKPPRPCAGSKTSPTAAPESSSCSSGYTCSSPSSSSGKTVYKPEKQDQTMEEVLDRPRSGEASTFKGPNWKLFAGGEQTRDGDGEIGEVNVDIITMGKSYQGQHSKEPNPGDYASKYRTYWC